MLSFGGASGNLFETSKRAPFQQTHNFNEKNTNFELTGLKNGWEKSDTYAGEKHSQE